MQCHGSKFSIPVIDLMMYMCWRIHETYLSLEVRDFIFVNNLNDVVLVHFLHELYTYLSVSPPRSKRRFIILVFPCHHTINIKKSYQEFVVYTSASVLMMTIFDVTSTSRLTHFEICFKDALTWFPI